MKICIVKHRFYLWFLIHHMDILPFDGKWNSSDDISLFDNNDNLLSSLSKHGELIHIENYGLEINVDEFNKLLESPNTTMFDFVKCSKNIQKSSYEEYEIAKFAKENHLKYGYVDTPNGLFFFIVKKTYSCSLESFIDPNNPFV